MWRLFFTKQARKDAKKAESAGLKEKIVLLFEALKEDPRKIPPPFEKLTGDLEGAYSRRINIQHRMVYQILERENAVKVLRLWTHYE